MARTPLGILLENRRNRLWRDGVISMTVRGSDIELTALNRYWVALQLLWVHPSAKTPASYRKIISPTGLPKKAPIPRVSPFSTNFRLILLENGSVDFHRTKRIWRGRPRPTNRYRWHRKVSSRFWAFADRACPLTVCQHLNTSFLDRYTKYNFPAPLPAVLCRFNIYEWLFLAPLPLGLWLFRP